MFKTPIRTFGIFLTTLRAHAGGDIVTCVATVISAIGVGKKAAKAIHEYLMKKVKEKKARTLL